MQINHRKMSVLSYFTQLKTLYDKIMSEREGSGSVVECLTRDQRLGSSLTGVTVFQPRKTRPYITERLLMGHKASNKKSGRS